MPSEMAEMLNRIFKTMPKSKPGEKTDDQAAREKRGVPPLPESLSLEELDFGEITGEKITPKTGIIQKDIIWYLHGGGFTGGSAKERRRTTFYLSETYGYTCIATNYRLAPEHKWPAQLDDCIKAYDILTRQEGYDPTHMILMGESAGGTLALSAALRLKAEGKPQPKALAAFSPCTELAVGFPSHQKNAATDYMLGDSLYSRGQYEAVYGIKDRAADVEKLKDVYLSPYYGDYSGLPPIFLAASDTEVLYDDASLLYEKLKKSGHPVEIDIQKGLCHGYVMFPQVPEAAETLKKAIDFIGKGEERI